MVNPFLKGLFLDGFYPDRIEVYVAGKNIEVFLFVHKNTFIPALIEVAYSSVTAIKEGCVGYIKVAHKFAEVADGGFHKQVKVVGHEDIAVELYCVDVERLIEYLEKLLSVGILPEDVILFISTAGDMIKCAWILNAKRTRHGRDYRTRDNCLSTVKI